MTIYKTFKNSIGETLEIYYDDMYFYNPMRDYDTIFNYYTWLDRHESIQENDYQDAESWFDDLVGDGEFYRIRCKSQESGKSLFGFLDLLSEKLDTVGIVAKPILSFEHSEITYYFGHSIDRWDGSIAGFAWQTKDYIRNYYGVKRITSKLRDRAFEAAEADLECYSNWANGNTYSFIFTDRDGEEDSCCGFISDNEEELLEMMVNNISTDDTSFKEVVEQVSMFA